jgi:hypothetical protein
MKYDVNINILHKTGIGYLNVESVNYPVNGNLRLSQSENITNYLNRASITDPIIKNNIANFYLGLEKLNLWNNTINFYLLKSGYNQVTGRTVYGFKSGYDGYLPNLDQTIWTNSGIFLKSGFASPSSSFSWESSGKGVIIHRPFEDMLQGNATIVMLGKTDISNTDFGYGAWWHQVDYSAGQRAIWHNPNAYYSCNEFMFGSGGDNGLTFNNPCPRLSTGQQYNFISYSNTFYPSLYSRYSGSGFISIYKDSNLVSSSQLTGVVIPRLCIDGYPYYPCNQYSGFIGGFYDAVGDSRLGTKNHSYIVFAAAFSKVLSNAEHSGLNSLILDTVAQNISLG